MIVSPASFCITDTFVHKQVLITLCRECYNTVVLYIVHTKVSDKNLAPFSKYHTAEQKPEYITTPCGTTVTITAKKYTEFFFSVITILNPLCTYNKRYDRQYTNQWRALTPDCMSQSQN